MNLSSYLEKREKELSNVSKLVQLLRSVKFPIEVSPENELLSKDYSLATNVEILKDYRSGESYSGYDQGSYHEEFRDYFPRFSFKISRNGLSLPVHIGEKVFDKIPSSVFMVVREVRGCKEYSYKTSGPTKTFPRSEETVLNFFQNKGVRDCVLKNLKEKIRVYSKEL